MKRICAVAFVIALVLPSLFGTGGFTSSCSDSSGEPYDILVSTISSSSATITWLTPTAVTGWIVYGYSPDNLENIWHDSRGSGTVDTTHIVELRLLAETTKVYYRIVSNGMAYGDDGHDSIISPGMPWNFTTFHYLDARSRWPFIVEVCITYPDGTPVNDALGVFIFSRTGQESVPTASISNKWGNFDEDNIRRNGSVRVNVATLRKPDGAFYPYQTGDLIRFRLDGGHRGKLPMDAGWIEETLVVSGDTHYLGSYMLLDTSPPILSAVEPGEVVLNDPLGLSVIAQDPYGVDSVDLHYKFSSSDWRNISMDLTEGNDTLGTWSRNIHMIETGSLLYYFTATDGQYTARNPSEGYYDITIKPRPPASLTASGPQTADSGEQFSFTVEIYDDQGNYTPPISHLFFYSTDIQASLPIDDGAGWENGTKTFHAVLRTADNHKITAEMAEGSLNSSFEIFVSPGSASQMEINPTSVSIVAGDTQLFQVEAQDAWGNPMDINPQWTTWGDVGTVDQEGLFLAETPGQGYVNVTYNGLKSSAQVGVMAGPPHDMLLHGGDGQNGTVAQPLAHEMMVMVVDEMNNPLEGVFVAWSIHLSPGDANPPPSLSTTLSPTNHMGLAGSTLIFGGKTGVYTVKASILGLSTIFFNATAFPGPASILVIDAPDALTAGETATIGYVVWDQYGNLNTTSIVENSLSSVEASLIDNIFRDENAGISAIVMWVPGYPSTYAERNVTIRPAEVVRIALEYDSITMSVASSRVLEPTGWDIYGNVNDTWSPVYSATMGSFAPGGIYGAGTTAGHSMINISAVGTDVFLHLNVTILPGELHRLVIEPNEAVLGTSSTLPVRAYGYDVYGNSVQTTPSWHLSSTIASLEDGILVPIHPGTVTITAYKGGVLETATVTIIDDSKPMVVRISISEDNVPVEASIRLFFSKPMNTTSMENAVELRNSKLNPVSVELISGGFSIELRPVVPLENNETYLLVMAGAKDTHGISMEILVFTFKTMPLSPKPVPGDGNGVDGDLPVNETEGDRLMISIAGNDIPLLPLMFLVLLVVLATMGIRKTGGSEEGGIKKNPREYSPGTSQDNSIVDGYGGYEPDFSDIIQEKRDAGDPLYTDSGVKPELKKPKRRV